MSAEKIERILVVGAGQMGHQIAMLCAIGGYKTVLQDVNNEALKKAEIDLQKRIGKWVDSGKLSEMDKNAAFKNLTFNSNLEAGAKDADFVIEAIVEKLEVKHELFKQLDQLTPKHAILASNSSTIVSSLLAEVTERPDKVCNMHFFFPPLVMDCVEVVMSETTSEETAQTVMAVCEQIGKTGVLLRKEVSGFVANRILGALNREAISLYENQVADYKDIDIIVKKSLGHPMGPFEIMDLSGIDIAYFVAQRRFEETGNPADKPPKCIVEKVKAGHLGRKTGQGFYNYS